MDYNTQNTMTEQSNTPLYIAIGLLVLSLIFTAYTYLSKDMVKKGDLKDKYVKTDNIEFNMLPSYIQSEYIKKYQYTSELSNLEDQLNNLKKQKNGSKTNCKETIVEVEKIIEIEKIVEVEKIIEVEKIVNINKEVMVTAKCNNDAVVALEKLENIVQIQDDMIKNVKERTKQIDKTKFNSYRCYEMDGRGVYPSANCISNLHKFLDNNKDSKLFEVIGISDKSEFVLLSKLKEYDYADESEIKRVAKFAQIGLLSSRVNEGIWSIKNYLGASTRVQTVNYSITSQKKNKGFVVRAYK